MCLTEDVNTARCLMCLSYLPFLGQQPDIKLHQQYIDQPVANWPILVLTTFINTKQNEIYMLVSEKEIENYLQMSQTPEWDP